MGFGSSSRFLSFFSSVVRRIFPESSPLSLRISRREGTSSHLLPRAQGLSTPSMSLAEGYHLRSALPSSLFLFISFASSLLLRLLSPSSFSFSFFLFRPGRDQGLASCLVGRREAEGRAASSREAKVRQRPPLPLPPLICTPHLHVFFHCCLPLSSPSLLMLSRPSSHLLQIYRPDVAILDEPFSALPEDEALLLLDQLIMSCRSVIFTTHSRILAQAATRVVEITPV